MTKIEYELTKKAFLEFTRSEILAIAHLDAIRSELEILDKQLRDYEKEN